MNKRIEINSNKNTENVDYLDILDKVSLKENIEELRERLGRMIKEQYVIRYPHQTQQW